MLDIAIKSIHARARDFAYITFKMQARMYESDPEFYGLKNTHKRISLFVFVCAEENKELLLYAREGIIDGFNTLKSEEIMPMLSYDTIDKILIAIDEKLERRSA